METRKYFHAGSGGKGNRRRLFRRCKRRFERFYRQPIRISFRHRGGRAIETGKILRGAARKSRFRRGKKSRRGGKNRGLCGKKLSKMEIDLAKAEIFNASSLPALLDEKRKLLETRRALLVKIGLTEKDLAPKFFCEKCSDTGFLPDGKACDCYKNAGN